MFAIVNPTMERAHLLFGLPHPLKVPVRSKLFVTFWSIWVRVYYLPSWSLFKNQLPPCLLHPKPPIMQVWPRAAPAT
jgi:hypothetical protein